MFGNTFRKMTSRREIYSIGYNKTITPEGMRISGYTLGCPAMHNGGRVPTEIKIEKIRGLDYVTTTFNDGYSHCLPFEGIEIMYREVKEEKI